MKVMRALRSLRTQNSKGIQVDSNNCGSTNGALVLMLGALSLMCSWFSSSMNQYNSEKEERTAALQQQSE